MQQQLRALNVSLESGRRKRAYASIIHCNCSSTSLDWGTGEERSFERIRVKSDNDRRVHETIGPNKVK